MSDLLTLSNEDLGLAFVERPLDALIQELRDLPWPEAGVSVRHDVQSFKVSSGAFRITDPAYPMTCEERGQSAGTIEHVANGMWNACVQSKRYEADLRRSKHWHQKRIDRVLDTAQKYAGDHVRYVLCMSLFDVVQKYKDAVTDCGNVLFLHVHHADYLEGLTDMLAGYERLAYRVDIEAGNAGFFDLDWITSKHPALGDETAYDKSATWLGFYRQMCSLTPSETLFGTCEHAAVAYGGNGGADCLVKRDSVGQVISARLVFNSNLYEGD